MEGESWAKNEREGRAGQWGRTHVKYFSLQIQWLSSYFQSSDPPFRTPPSDAGAEPTQEKCFSPLASGRWFRSASREEVLQGGWRAEGRTCFFLSASCSPPESQARRLLIAAVSSASSSGIQCALFPASAPPQGTNHLTGASPPLAGSPPQRRASQLQGPPPSGF